MSVGRCLCEKVAPPNGLTEIVARFGDPRRYVAFDGKLKAMWEREHTTTVPIPWRPVLQWAPAVTVGSVRVHVQISAYLRHVMEQLHDLGLSEHLWEYGGGFNWRPQTGAAAKPSLHAWALAWDWCPTENPRGKKPTMNADVVKVFESHNFTWGGRWAGKRVDGMHFQFARGF